MREEIVMILPNPDVKREECSKECVGCRRMFKENVVCPVCISFQSPKSKWRNYYVGYIEKVEKGQTLKSPVYYNPCNMASHVKHYVAPKQHEKHRFGQQKHS